MRDKYRSSFANGLAARNKLRAAYRRGQNFLDRNSLSFSFRELEIGDIGAVRKVIEDHFEVLEVSKKRVGSCALDYEQLLANILPSNKQYISLLGILRSKENELATSVFLAEKTGDTVGSLYCSITNRNPESILRAFPGLDLKGFTALPQFALTCLFAELLRRGFQDIDLGGSETEELDRFKRQMGAQELVTTWKVMTRRSVNG